MVRLKGNASQTIIHIQDLFQFHYGSVKSNIAIQSLLNSLLFQFHYGSVKRVAIRFILNIAFKFQFHYGSVKSWRYIYAGQRG